MANRPTVCVVGGGMITQVQILPSLYQLRRIGLIGEIHVCALNSGPLRSLAENMELKAAFPGQSFRAHPSLETDPAQEYPDLFREVLGRMGKNAIVVVAMPDQLHYMVIREALRHEQHLCCVKPLVLRHEQAVEIEREAYEKGLAVGVEYHKRLDDRALMARRQYREGLFGEFKLGHAELNEPYYYRHSNFRNWCTCENSDMFTYVGCHYVDQVHFITGLLPTSLSVYGIVDSYPNGNKGYLWTSARVLWENGACLNVINVMGYPDQGPGSNFQGLRMYCAGKDRNGMLVHNDQYRGIEYCYVEKMPPPDDKYFCEPNPDYLKFVDLGGGGLTPVGYGFRSIEYIFRNICKVVEADTLAQRRELLTRYDEEGIMATPKNSAYNELVMEAGRLSIQNGGREVAISYGPQACVALK